MKVETPQILWHNGSERDDGKNAPLYSLDLLSTGAATATPDTLAHNFDGHDILVTAGNSSEIHLWNIHMKQPKNDNDNTSNPHTNTILQVSSTTDIRHLITLNRHDRSVNIVKFSPNGRFLATAGDGGTIIIWTCASRSDWSRIEKENDLHCRVIHTPCAEGICDLDWSSSSNRFIVGSIDHSVLIYELSGSGSNGNAMNGASSNKMHISPTRSPPSSSQNSWNCIYRNSKDHTHFVQGVAYDPLGHYVTSMGSDRTVRVYPRKVSKKKASKKKSNSVASAVTVGTLTEQSNNNNSHCNSPTTNAATAAAVDHKSPTTRDATTTTTPGMTQSQPQQLHADYEKLELMKCKTLKYFSNTNKDTTTTTTLDSLSSSPGPNNNNSNNNNNNASSGSKEKKHYLFADESTVESFFRRLRFTTDGAFLIVPTALWHHPNQVRAEEGEPSSSSSSLSSSFATHIYARHHYDKPYKVLHGLEKPSVVIRPNPVLFQLPKNPSKQEQQEESTSSSCTDGEKENKSPPPPKSSSKSKKSSLLSCGLPYRHVFCVLTLDSILIYDTYHSRPLAIARGLHYAGLTDAAWSADGHHLVVSSTDGYISIVSFTQGELGQVYKNVPPLTTTTTTTTTSKGTTKSPVRPLASNTPPLPPCEPGPANILIARPLKRAKQTPPSSTSTTTTTMASKTVTPPTTTTTTTTTTAVTMNTKKRESDDATTKEVGQAVTKLSLNQPPTKKKKRIQPTLLTTVN